MFQAANDTVECKPGSAPWAAKFTQPGIFCGCQSNGLADMRDDDNDVLRRRQHERVTIWLSSVFTYSVTVRIVTGSEEQSIVKTELVCRRSKTGNRLLDPKKGLGSEAKPCQFPTGINHSCVGLPTCQYMAKLTYSLCIAWDTWSTYGKELITVKQVLHFCSLHFLSLKTTTTHSCPQHEL